MRYVKEMPELVVISSNIGGPAGDSFEGAGEVGGASGLPGAGGLQATVVNEVSSPARTASPRPDRGDSFGEGMVIQAGFRLKPIANHRTRIAIPAATPLVILLPPRCDLAETSNASGIRQVLPSGVWSVT